MTALLPLPILLPLLGAALSILAGRSRLLQRAIGIGVLSAVTGIAVAILVHVDRHGPAATQGGGWPAPLGITLVADRLSALLLVVATSMLLVVLLYAIGQPGAERNHVGFQSVYLVLAAGVSAAFLTGDLFNLFVAIEMMLTASYVLITLGGRLDQVRAGMTYVVISLLASTLFLATLAYTYAATGTVNLADLAEKVPGLPDGTRAALAVALLVVFGIKAALVPLHFWLPDAYPTAPSPVTAIFAGLLTKVGVYAIIRTQTLLFPHTLPRGLFFGIDQHRRHHQHHRGAHHQGRPSGRRPPGPERLPGRGGSGREGTMSRRPTNIALGVVLLAIWLLLWGSASVANIVGGLAVVGVVLAMIPDEPARGAGHTLRPLWAARFLGRVLVDLVVANGVVTREIVSRGSSVNTGIVAVPMPMCSEEVLTLVSNVLALAPGTMPVEVTRVPPVIYVHVLHLRDVEAVRRDIGHLAELAVRAFGSPEAVAALP